MSNTSTPQSVPEGIPPDDIKNHPEQPKPTPPNVVNLPTVTAETITPKQVQPQNKQEQPKQEKQENIKVKALVHLETIRKNIKNYEGKEGMNPFMFNSRVLKPLEKRLKSGDEKAAADILGIRVDVLPKVPNNII